MSTSTEEHGCRQVVVPFQYNGCDEDLMIKTKDEREQVQA